MAKKTLKQLREEHPHIKSRSIKGFLKKLEEARGLGDTIEAITEATGIKKAVEFFTPEGKDCGCDERKEKLNKVFRYSECMFESEYTWWTDFLVRYNTAKNNTVSGKISGKDIWELHRLYRRLFRVNLKICANCGSAKRVIDEAVKNINIIYDSYQK